VAGNPVTSLAGGSPSPTRRAPRPRAGRFALLASYVAATFFAFPHPVAGRVVDLGLVLAWASPALLVLGLDGLAPRRAALMAFAAALAAQAAILHWIYVVTVVYGHAPVLAGVVAPVALAAYAAAFTGVFGAGSALFASWGVASPFALALLWTVFSGFPWATLGYAQHDNAALLGIASFTAVYGLSFVTVLGGAAAARALRDLLARRRPSAGVWVALATVAAAHAAGFAAGRSEPGFEPGTIRVAVLQGNIEQGVKWSRAWADRTLAIYEDLSRRAADEGARVVVWPETAVPGIIDTDLVLRRRLAKLARDARAVFVVGGVGGYPLGSTFHCATSPVASSRRWPGESRPPT
jgi:apolipoprotein N-acyltransferase